MKNEAYFQLIIVLLIVSLKVVTWGDYENCESTWTVSAKNQSPVKARVTLKKTKEYYMNNTHYVETKDRKKEESENTVCFTCFRNTKRLVCECKHLHSAGDLRFEEKSNVVYIQQFKSMTHH